MCTVFSGLVEQPSIQGFLAVRISLLITLQKGQQ